jgi:deoxycytidylate deaminase
MIRLATRQALRSSYIYKLGAILTKGKRVLAVGYNSISHCQANDFKNSRHAEMDVILKLMNTPNGLEQLAHSTLYVSRITKTGVGLAKPCVKCMDLARSVGVKEVIYTTDNGVERVKL